MPLVNAELCFKVILNLVNAKDTLEKETENDELIVSIIDLKATSHNVIVKDKVVAVIAEDDEINEVITVHLVKIIVPFLFGAPRCPR